jgi:serine-protein kinase ATM
MSNYFDPAIKLLSEAKPTTSSHATVFHACAIFAEHQYQNIQNSPDAIRYKVYVDRKVQEIQSRAAKINSMKSLPQQETELKALGNDQRRAIAMLNEDKERFEQHNSSRRLFLELAINMYARALAVSDEFDDDGVIIRLCSLWFANFDDARLQERTLRAALDRVPSRKFVFLAHQLAARLSSPTSSSSSSSSSKGQASSSQEALHRLMLRVCRDHPFHSLYQVYCLRPTGGSSSSSSANEQDTTRSRRTSTRHEPPAVQHERAEAAKSIFDKLRHDPASQARLDGVEKVCNASLEWASLPIKHDPRFEKKKGPFAVPEQLMIRRLSSKQVQVPVITAHTPIDPTTKYEDCVWIDRFEAMFDTAGGINLPKIINCYGSDGVKYKQLVSGA